MLERAEIILIFVVYALMNGIVFTVYLMDKRAARKDRWRTRENTLLFLAFIGPFGACAAMRICRHKTRKIKFYLVPVFLMLHIAVLIWVLLYFLN